MHPLWPQLWVEQNKNILQRGRDRAIKKQPVGQMALAGLRKLRQCAASRQIIRTLVRMSAAKCGPCRFAHPGLLFRAYRVPARGTKSQTPISKARPKEQPVEAPLLERSQEIQKILLIVLL